LRVFELLSPTTPRPPLQRSGSRLHIFAVLHPLPALLHLDLLAADLQRCCAGERGPVKCADLQGRLLRDAPDRVFGYGKVSSNLAVGAESEEVVAAVWSGEREVWWGFGFAVAGRVIE
jgi:hypothetical protein